ncbi:MAG: hypothetical protein IKZ71_04470 [Bacteroidales bacterium]|nr:hypothetical protein [Bacteroidales bacterium]
MKLFKPLALILMTMFTISSSPVKTDDEGHVLVDLWKQYQTADLADKPKTQEGLLVKIKAEAKEKHLSWDYYDAAVKLVQVRTSVNWKLREQEEAARNKDLKEFGEPIVEYFLMVEFQGLGQDRRKAFVADNQEKLKKAHNPGFYRHNWRLNRRAYGRVLAGQLSNDYEYCLWSLGDGSELMDYFKEYPLSAFAEYESIPSSEGRKEKLEAYSKKWQGKAAGLLAEQDLLQMRFDELDELENGRKKGTSADFEALRDQCNAFNRKRASFKEGVDKKIADELTKVDLLLHFSLEAKDKNITIEDGKATIKLQNLGAVTVRILEGKKTVWEKYLTNPYKSCYVEDILLVDLPDLADGDYAVELDVRPEKISNLEDEVEYKKYTISASLRKDADGVGVWATDFVSGEPLGKVDVELIKDKKVVEKASLVLDGYTPLPASMAGRLASGKGGYAIRVRSGKRASKPVYLYSYGYGEEADDTERINAVLMTDRGAYNPDETMHFKAVLYKGDYELKAVRAGVKVKAELYDTEGKQIESMTLTTNEFGSVAGDMALKRRNRNGMYELRLSKDGKHICNRWVRVDDFVLPSFDLIFDKENSFERPVKEIKYGGRLYSYSGHSLTGSAIMYRIRHYREIWKEGELHPDKDGRFDISFAPDSSNTGYDNYQLEVKVIDSTGETMEWNRNLSIYPPSIPRVETEYFFKEKEGLGSEQMELKVVAGDKPVWMVVEAHGTGKRLLWSRVERFAPESGPASTCISYKMKEGDPETMTIYVLYFQNKKCYSHSCELRKEDHRYDLPLSFTRFLDTTAPGAGYTFEIKTLSGVECAAAVFDKSTERYAANVWNSFRAQPVPSPHILRNSECGIDASDFKTVIIGYGKVRGLMRSKATPNMVMMDSAEESATVQSSGSIESGGSADIPLRENFANTIAWEPFLRSDGDGSIKFSFTNADKLSTYYVQLFAHDKKLRNETIRREMVVTIPVKISLVEPQFLYEGDRYMVRIALSSALSKDIDGTLSVNGVTEKVMVPAKGSINKDVELKAEGGKLDIKAVFRPGSGSFGADGVQVSIPVKKAEQTLTEAHSAILLSGADKAELEAGLRAMFKNVDGSLPALEEIDIRRMLFEAVPAELEISCDNSISVSKALYAWSLCKKIGVSPFFDKAEAVQKLLACRNSDGGFAWFPGMNSSPVVTAVVLKLVHGLGIVDEAAAVQYIDKEFFKKGFSLNCYLNIRSMFPEVPFTEKTSSDFRKDVRAYLVPKKERGLDGWIAAKAQRVQTLDNFLSKDGGTALASKMGIMLGTASKLRKSLSADIESLVQYAQPHKCGGMYYPNAVMPWRGLLESELDAHCTLIDIMDRFGHSEISNGIRLWIMVQKETQDWKQQPGYIEALGAVLNGPESVLDTKVLALKASYSAPFDKVRASGNGMSIARKSVPEVLHIGDRIKLSVDITNEENRSFVKLTIPFGAGLIPVDQKSGYRWGYYRNVLKDRIECWYEVYPEEKTTVTEEFFVTRAGSFQAPVATIECEYAPHYRANDAWNGRLEVSAE